MVRPSIAAQTGDSTAQHRHPGIQLTFSDIRHGDRAANMAAYGGLAHKAGGATTVLTVVVLAKIEPRLTITSLPRGTYHPSHVPAAEH
jgi:hypothetical protein